MKTNRKIRASFSADDVVDLSLPKGWGDLDSKELSKVYEYMERYDDEDVRIHLFRYFAQLKSLRQDPVDGKYICTLPTYKDDKIVNAVVRLTPEMLAEWIEDLDWIADPGMVPVRIDNLGGADAVDAQFHGVTFRTYYMVENYYQGYIMSKNPAAIAMIEKLLYPDTSVDDEPGLARVLNILNWLVQVKNVFSRTFTYFFKPSGGESAEEPNMLDIMNNQIRALTGGDVTKEETINSIDCWRALTELDYKAKEAEEFRRQQAKIKK